MSELVVESPRAWVHLPDHTGLAVLLKENVRVLGMMLPSVLCGEPRLDARSLVRLDILG